MKNARECLSHPYSIQLLSSGKNPTLTPKTETQEIYASREGKKTQPNNKTQTIKQKKPTQVIHESGTQAFAVLNVNKQKCWLFCISVFCNQNPLGLTELNAISRSEQRSLSFFFPYFFYKSVNVS